MEGLLARSTAVRHKRRNVSKLATDRQQDGPDTGFCCTVSTVQIDVWHVSLQRLGQIHWRLVARQETDTNALEVGSIETVNLSRTVVGQSGNYGLPPRASILRSEQCWFSVTVSGRVPFFRPSSKSNFIPAQHWTILNFASITQLSKRVRRL